MRPHRRPPTRLPRPWDSPGKNTEWVAISFSNAWKWKVKEESLSRGRLLATLWTVAYQAPPSMGFSRQEYWRGLPLPSLQNVADRKQIQICFLELSGIFFWTCSWSNLWMRNPWMYFCICECRNSVKGLLYLGEGCSRSTETMRTKTPRWEHVWHILGIGGRAVWLEQSQRGERRRGWGQRGGHIFEWALPISLSHWAGELHILNKGSLCCCDEWTLPGKGRSRETT